MRHVNMLSVPTGLMPANRVPHTVPRATAGATGRQGFYGQEGKAEGHKTVRATGPGRLPSLGAAAKLGVRFRMLATACPS